jgi:uncharacterized protein (DUF1015 family)
MPELKPFRAILYNKEKVSLDNVVAPPYDVITSEQQLQLYERHPNNIIRLILGRENNWYAEAVKIFQEWQAEKVLQFDDEPALYILAQEFHLEDGKRYLRKGFVAACKLEALGDGSIYPHEKTLSKPKEDRFKLFQATNAMFSQIFSLYGDEEHVLDKYLDDVMMSNPILETKFDGVLNKVWRLTGEATIGTIAGFMKQQRVLIADGHHRYETALLYRDAMRRQVPHSTGKEAFNFVPIFFTNMYDEGLVILPTHRVLHTLPNFSSEFFIQKLEPYFRIEQLSTFEGLQQRLCQKMKRVFGVVLSGEPKYLYITLRDFTPLITFDVPPVYWNLDVAILHTIIFKRLFGISEEAQEKKLNLDYVKEGREAVQMVESGKAQAAFLLHPTPIEQVREIAEAGYTMPQKSTYFYPKLLSGLLTYSFLHS